MRYIVTPFIATVLCLPANPVFALEQDSAQGQGQNIMQHMDQDGDNQASQEEFTQMMQQRFSKMDADGDGFVGNDEFKGQGDMFSRVDENGDGKLSPDEQDAMIEKRFQNLDQDQNGTLSEDEISAMQNSGKRKSR